MPLIYQPRLGAVLRCDFTSMGWMKPEMVKHRDVVVIARNKKNPKLVTVVPLSTTAPTTIEAYHPQLSNNPQPDGDPNIAVWAKCDMVYTVSIDRLDLYYKQTRRGRETVTRVLPAGDLKAVKDGVAAALGLASPQVAPLVASAPPPKATATTEHHSAPVSAATVAVESDKAEPTGPDEDSRKTLSLSRKTTQNLSD